MNNEVLEFAEAIGAQDLKRIFDSTEFRKLFKRRNYFLLDNDKYLMVKISRSTLKVLWGFGVKYLDFFKNLTYKSGSFYIVTLISNTSGWIWPKKEILSLISDGTLSYSETQREYKINKNNIDGKEHLWFSSIDEFLNLINII